MIPGNSISWQPVPDWQRELAQAIRTPRELIEALNLPLDLLPLAEKVHHAFPVRVPRGFVRRMKKGDISDPLLLQVLPLHAELELTPGYSNDPVGDDHATQAPGVIHKYHGRVLLITTGACAIHCRYCFRRHYPYNDSQASTDHWKSAIDYITQRSDVHEVILSGGDPLSLGTNRFRALVNKIECVSHVRTLRIHSRLPIVLPERVDQELLATLKQSRLKLVMVVHANHPQEINHEVREAFAALQNAGVRLFNQSVLLKQINDNAKILSDLCELLFDSGVQPYYLHLLDRVQGAAHFEVEHRRALSIYEELQRTLPGYCVPRLVREQSGAPYKLPVPYTIPG